MIATRCDRGIIKDHMQDLVLIIIIQLVPMTRISNLQNFSTYNYLNIL